ncbi:MAG: hypothetical protein KDE59_21475 [Anaerolineales bacterium]|nr:hypothetical protein [Anaerolineales bacterium]MCB8959127.1 hypothetical protein [Ardenticatenales bacterium]
MKRSTLYGAFLTLLMFWLVILAVVVFLFQARGRLNQDVATLNDEKQSLNEELSARNNQLATAQSGQALAIQELSTRDAELGEAQNQQSSLENELATSQSAIESLAAEATAAAASAAELQATLTAVQQQPPFVRLIAPTADTAITPNEPTEIIIAATDPDGLSLIALAINEENQLFEGHGETLITITVPWTPAAEGSYVIAVSAVDLTEQSSEAVELTLDIVDVDARNAAIRAEVEANVLEIRGLELLAPIVPTLLTRAELAERVETDFFGDYSEEDAADEALIYCAFDFVTCDFDLYEFLISVYSGAIAGFYDPETAEFVVVADGGLLSSSEQWTHAHEFMHALQDQHFGLDQISDDSMDSEAAAAFRALAEGEATLIQLLYLPYFSPEEQATLFEDDGSPDPFAGAPAFFREQILFPYSEGFDFVQTIYDEGGFDRLDEVWADPPVSTEQILHPELYEAGNDPIPVPLPPLTDTLGTGWRQIDEDVVGEFMLRQYLEQGISSGAAEDAAAGWGGDRFALYYNDADSELVLVLRTVWDSVADNSEFQSAYQLYGETQFGDNLVPEAFPEATLCWQPEGEVVCLIAEDNVTSTIVRAPSLELIQTIWDELQS